MYWNFHWMSCWGTRAQGHERAQRLKISLADPRRASEMRASLSVQFLSLSCRFLPNFRKSYTGGGVLLDNAKDLRFWSDGSAGCDLYWALQVWRHRFLLLRHLFLSPPVRAHHKKKTNKTSNNSIQTRKLTPGCFVGGHADAEKEVSTLCN